MTDNPGAGRNRSRAIQIVLLAVGALVFAEMIRTADHARIAAGLAGIGLFFLPIVLAEFLFDLLCTFGWLVTLPRACRPRGMRLFAIRMAGTSINQVTPSLTLGGEPVKAMLLAPEVPLSTGLASVIAAQGSFMIGQAIMICAGLLMMLRLIDLPDFAAPLAAISFVVLTSGLFYFVRLQKKGLAPLLTALAGIPLLRSIKLASLITGAEKLDICMSELYGRRPGDFILSIGFHVAARIVSVFQTLLILHALGISAGVTACIMIQAASILLDLPSVIIPGRLGLHEGGRMFIFHALGFGTGIGLSYALAQRLVQILMIAVGLLLFARFQIQPAPLRRADCESSP
ncbi:MAG: flippase-like domain-containing protein [Candidatus Hydrogenedentota bacterium]